MLILSCEIMWPMSTRLYSVALVFLGLGVIPPIECDIPGSGVGRTIRKQR